MITYIQTTWNKKKFVKKPRTFFSYEKCMGCVYSVNDTEIIIQMSII